MIPRLIRWFSVNVVVALLPLAASLFIHNVSGQLHHDLWKASPELLFFSLTLSVTALGELMDLSRAIGREIVVTLSQSVLLIGILWTGLMYGAYLHEIAFPNSSSALQKPMLQMSIGIAITTLILGTIIEVFISKVLQNHNP